MMAIPFRTRRKLRQPTRIVELNRRRRIMKPRRALDASDVEWKVIWMVAIAFGLLLATGLIKARDPEPCSARVSINGRILEAPGVWIETSAGPQCRVRIKG